MDHDTKIALLCIRHTSSDKVENAALYYLSGLAFCPCHNPSSHQSEDFGKRSSNRLKLKTPAFLCSVYGKHFENRTFRKPREEIVQVNAGIKWVSLEGFQLNIYVIYV